MIGAITLFMSMATSFGYVTLCPFFCVVQSETTAATATSSTVSVPSETTNESTYVATTVYNAKYTM